MTATPATDTRLGILMMLAGISMFAVNDALGKWLVADYPVTMLLAIRSLFAAAILLPPIWREGAAAVFVVPRLKTHLMRVGCATFDIVCFYWAVRYLPLADVMTIYMASPLMVTALSVVFLNEKVGWRRWSAVAVGFVGVVIVLNPSGQFDLLPSLVALIGAVGFSVGLILTRSLRGAGGLTLISYQTFGGLVLGGVALPIGWVTPDWVDFFLLGLLGITALFAHTAINKSLQVSPAAVVVPFQYVSIVWAASLDLLVWGTAPSLRIAAGASLIIGSGLFIFYREQKLQRGQATETGADMGAAD